MSQILQKKPDSDSIEEIRDEYGNIKELIKESIDDIKIKSKAHDIMFRKYRQIDKLIELPSIIFDAIVSTSLFFYFTQENPVNWVIILAIILSSTSFIISTIRKFYNFTYKYHSHDSSSKLYNQVHREIQMVLIKNHLDHDIYRDLYGDTVKQISIIEEYEEPLSFRLIESIRKIQNKNRNKKLTEPFRIS